VCCYSRSLALVLKAPVKAGAFRPKKQKYLLNLGTAAACRRLVTCQVAVHRAMAARRSGLGAAAAHVEIGDGGTTDEAGGGGRRGVRQRVRRPAAAGLRVGRVGGAWSRTRSPLAECGRANGCGRRVGGQATVVAAGGSPAPAQARSTIAATRGGESGTAGRLDRGVAAAEVGSGRPDLGSHTLSLSGAAAAIMGGMGGWASGGYRSVRVGCVTCDALGGWADGLWAFALCHLLSAEDGLNWWW